MRAAVYRGREHVTIDDVPEPECPPGHVKLRVAHNGICGTDLHEYYAGPIFFPTEPHPLTGMTLPLVMGHEFAGTVVEAGEGVTAARVGDRVTVEPIHRCGSCPPCQEGRYNVCRRIGFHGLMAHGGMAEYTVVPEQMLHRLPDEVSWELGAMVEPMAVAYHAARLGGVGPGGHAVVFGAGPIGIGLWFALRGEGVEDITVVEPSAERRAALERLGARDVIDPRRTDPVRHVMRRTKDRGAAAAYDAAGVEASVDAALSCVAAHRPVVSVAVYERPLTTPLLKLVLSESRIQGSLCYTAEDYRRVIELMAAGHYDTEGWVGHIPLERLHDEGFAALHAGRKMKVLVDL
ncbi:dehydrogenase [Streptomyces sp. Ru71]|uniref:2,3-butanediol dehydrogenase n=1 Tax=Streptomyces sp. Ru71 TaxID=2080746 RepID=UPI000CDE429E|nr:2,3-butanediol dehydrogenase [Streptomyces sp. Ru71]POX50840.1 dehydrogenase [Streptomyces sp. Ru71]